MKQSVILDTGPLVAFLNSRDAHHRWAKTIFAHAPAPLLTCEAVLAEACHLVRAVPKGIDRVLEMAEREVIALAFDLSEEQSAVRSLARRYSSVPMSLADSCLVRMSELIPDSVVFTLDSDFRIYRRHRRQPIPLLTPSSG